ncbi:unnamed protein product [Polarella glacialis]|uniref:Dienelactone hydrolase domain-containing protein n=1 Tax=Polarella glacialis TaxID=89957 RepID=A0A813EUF3_POLGL|nr:unnamed protein product [Polarella glacialis]
MDAPCCVGVVRDSSSLVGKDITVGKDLPAYYSAPKLKSGKRMGIVVVHDIFGTAIPNCKYIVDHFASKGFDAVMPDFYTGKAHLKLGLYFGDSAVAMAGGAQAVLVRNGEASMPWLSKHSLLHDYPGAYTTARTVGRHSIFELSMHCQRLHDTAKDVLRRQLEGSEAKHEADCLRQASEFLEQGGPAALLPVVRQSVLAALEFLETQEASGGDAEYQVTMLLTCGTAGSHTPTDRGFDFLTYVQPLPYVEPMVTVEAHQAERKNPTIKDVQWVNDRQQLEEIQKAAGVNEVVMYDENGHITEGLQTNFFAVTADGVLITAPAEKVLSGTVRKVVLDVARDHGLQVRFECPNIKDLNSWDSCFVCSTSRLVKPVSELGAPEFFPARRHFPQSGSAAHNVEALVLEAVRSHSEPLTLPALATTPA